jgi:hypothetical protein
MREWMDEHLPRWMLGVIDWPGYRLLGECWAEDCPVPSRGTSPTVRVNSLDVRARP